MTTTTTTKAMSLKDRGNELLAAGDVPGALAAYSQGLASLEPRESPTALYLNSALALARLEQHDRAVDMCTKALDSDPGNAKALYRRAKSRIALNLLELAAVDARTLLQVNPKSQAGGELLRELAKTVRQMDQGARKLLSEACASGASRDLMRQLIGMVHEDEVRLRGGRHG
jgi:tetratricopeptide (TPR) repeat protein